MAPWNRDLKHLHELKGQFLGWTQVSWPQVHHTLTLMVIIG